MTITLILSEAAIRGFREEAMMPTPYTAVAEAVDRFGGSISPMHPGEMDPYLSRFFRVEVPASDQAEAAVRSLAGLDGVEAAYVKPPDALP